MRSVLSYWKLSQAKSLISLISSFHSSQPLFAEGEDKAQLNIELKTLLRAHGGQWHLMSSGKGLERCYQFKTFGSTW
ncbi:hypothetical protein MMC20_004866, partial [Loxospora ochrophaea]|nr:hypothetical protein [Loxospora ochrophaea]